MVGVASAAVVAVLAGESVCHCMLFVDLVMSCE